MEKKEAMKILKDFYDKSALFSIRTALDTVFPEFKESEDERIMGNIIATIHLYYGEPLEDEAKEMVAWLEKQSEQKYTHRDIDNAYLKGIADVKCEVEKIDEQTEKMKKEIAEFIFNSKEDIKQRYEWIKCLGFDVKFSNEEKQGEQKPADTEKGAKGNNRDIPNSVWSEEDENRFKNLIELIEQSDEGQATKIGFIGFINMLKSLKERYIWKPSEEMLEALYRAVPDNVKEMSEDGMLLDKLYQGLKYGRVISNN